MWVFLAFFRVCLCIAISYSALNSAAQNRPSNVGKSVGITGEFIVKIKTDALKRNIHDPTSINIKNRINQGGFKKVFAGFSGKFTSGEIEIMKANPLIETVEPNQVYSINKIQQNASWGLDRIDQESLPYDFSYQYEYDGQGVNVYILDTGINGTHPDFGGRSFSVGYSSITKSSNAADDNGHGTHVAGIVGSNSYGVAKKAQLISVKVFDSNGISKLSAILEGLEWIAENAKKPAVVNISMSGPPSNILDDAVRKLISDGVIVVVSAGNNNKDACNESPARVVDAITVAASSLNDHRSQFSNFGKCVDLFAPGEKIDSLYIRDGKSTYAQLSGTSQSAAFVTGAVALMLQANQQASPEFIVKQLLVSASKNNVINANADNFLLNALVASGGTKIVAPPMNRRPEVTYMSGKSNPTALLWSAEVFLSLAQPKLPQLSTSGIPIVVEFRGALLNRVLDKKTCVTSMSGSCSLQSIGFFYGIPFVSASVASIGDSRIPLESTTSSTNQVKILAPKNFIQDIICFFSISKKNCQNN